ncbi:MAG TPA: tetratricopeptide repeat protein [Acidobacteriaceae bacterium]|nr:tetratricopeptide repeat protein [Acidobacteriaceae bacterium]
MWTPRKYGVGDAGVASATRLILALLVLAVLALCLPALGQSARDVVASTTAALESGEFDKALALLRPAIQQSPRNPQLWMLQGLAESGKGDRKSALASYQAALRVSPDYLPALEGAAQLQYEVGNPAAAPLLQHVLRLRPGDVTSHAMLAVLDYRNGDCARAVKHFSQSEPALGSQPGALQEYGFCLLKLKQTEKALQIFRGLLDTHPEDARARRALAAVQLSADQPQNALATLQPLLQSSPDVDTMRLASAIYEANHDTPNAVKVLREAIVQDPKDTALYADFADLAMDHQSFQAGIDMIDSGLRLQPASAQLYLARGVLYVQMAQYDKAEADFDKAEQLDPRQGLSAVAEGLVAEERDQSDPDKALAAVRMRLRRKPGDAFLWYLQAAILSQKAPDPGSSEFAQGLASAKKAVSLDSSLTAAHNVLAKYYLDAGQNALAAKECRLALDRNPADQTALYHLVIALRKTHQQSEIPDVLKRLARARQDAARQEAERNRYKLVVSSAGTPAPSAP